MKHKQDKKRSYLKKRYYIVSLLAVLFSSTAQASCWWHPWSCIVDLGKHLIGKILHDLLSFLTHPVELAKSLFSLASSLFGLIFGAFLSHTTPAIDMHAAAKSSPSYQGGAGITTFAAGSTLHSKLTGNTSTFPNKLQKFKQHNQTCPANDPNCYSNTSSNSAALNTKYRSPNEAKAANTFANNVSGPAIAKPKSHWAPTPEVINYTANYKTASAHQSIASGSISKTIEHRQPINIVKNGNPQPPTPGDYSNKKVYSANAHAQSLNQNMLNNSPSYAKLPIFGNIITSGQAVGASGNTLHYIGKGSSSLASKANSLNIQTGQAVHESVGKPMYENYRQSISSTPKKSHGSSSAASSVKERIIRLPDGQIIRVPITKGSSSGSTLTPSQQREINKIKEAEKKAAEQRANQPKPKLTPAEEKAKKEADAAAKKAEEARKKITPFW